MVSHPWEPKLREQYEAFKAARGNRRYETWEGWSKEVRRLVYLASGVRSRKLQLRWKGREEHRSRCPRAQDGSDDEDEEENYAPMPDMDGVTEGRIVFERNAPMLDLAAICWEELMLALPVTPLCRKDCKGLCAGCGVNLNEGMCACTEEEGDPRMAALRGLTLHKN